MFWGHEPRADGWTDPQRVAAYMYNTGTGQGMQWRVPDAPFAVETFCIGDHGIVTGYRQSADLTVDPVLASPDNPLARAWGMPLYRQALHAFCAALTTARPIPDDDARPMIWQVMDAFWTRPTRAEADAWGAYPYHSDPAGTAIRPLARRIAGSLALSTEPARTMFLRQAPPADLTGSPAAD